MRFCYQISPWAQVVAKKCFESQSTLWIHVGTSRPMVQKLFTIYLDSCWPLIRSQSTCLSHEMWTFNTLVLMKWQSIQLGHSYRTKNASIPKLRGAMNSFTFHATLRISQTARHFARILWTYAPCTYQMLQKCHLYRDNRNTIFPNCCKCEQTTWGT